MSHYSFPILQNREVLLCLNELSIEVVEDDLVHPTPGKVQHVYSQLIELLLNQRREDMMQPAFSGMAVCTADFETICASNPGQESCNSGPKPE